MSEQSQRDEPNPLDTIADELSTTLGGQPVELTEERTERVAGGQVAMRSSAARSVQASALHMEESAAGLARTGSLDMHDSAVGVATARTAAVADSAVGLLVAGRVQAEQVRTLAVIGAHIEGDVQSVLTPLTAVLAGAGFALTLVGLSQLFGQRAKNRNRKHDLRSA